MTLSLLQYTCDRIAVMYLGQIVEIGPSRENHRESAASLHPGARLGGTGPGPRAAACQAAHRRGLAPGDTRIPSELFPFRDRCPDVMDVCATSVPEAVEVSDRHLVGCHLYD